MTRNWEETFESWSAGPGQTETYRIYNAERMIRDAIAASDKLKNRGISVFTQGSYRNNVNVRQESDIDIGVVCSDTFYYDFESQNLRELVTPTILPASYSFSDFKRDLQEALETKFGQSSVRRGNKAFDISANSYRVEADVAPFFEHRRYYSQTDFHKGVQMLSDYGQVICNWPDQHYDNGVSKNTATSRRYKRTVRIFKKLSIEMTEARIAAADLPGFFIECLIWNVPNEVFSNHNSHLERVRQCILSVFRDTQQDDTCSEWGEVNELKYLFRGQPWTRAQANDFMVHAYNYLGFE